MWAGLTYTRPGHCKHFPLSVLSLQLKQEVLLHKGKKPWLQYLFAARSVDLSVQLILRCYPQLCSTIVQLDHRLPRVGCLTLETNCHLPRTCPDPSTVLCLCMQQGRRFDLIGLASWVLCRMMYACATFKFNKEVATLHLCSIHSNTMINPHISLLQTSVSLLHSTICCSRSSLRSSY